MAFQHTIAIICTTYRRLTSALAHGDLAASHMTTVRTCRRLRHHPCAAGWSGTWASWAVGRRDRPRSDRAWDQDHRERRVWELVPVRVVYWDYVPDDDARVADSYLDCSRPCRAGLRVWASSHALRPDRRPWSCCGGCGSRRTCCLRRRCRSCASCSRRHLVRVRWRDRRVPAHGPDTEEVRRHCCHLGRSCRHASCSRERPTRSGHRWHRRRLAQPLAVLHWSPKSALATRSCYCRHLCVVWELDWIGLDLHGSVGKNDSKWQLTVTQLVGGFFDTGLNGMVGQKCCIWCYETY